MKSIIACPSVLVTRSLEVTGWQEALKVLVAGMWEAMYAATGIGLAAPQLGVNWRVVVVDVSGGVIGAPQLVLVNPVIMWASATIEEAAEGCLSLPGIQIPIKRPIAVTVKYQDIDGEGRELTAAGLTAKAICHEIDHLDGILITARARIG